MCRQEPGRRARGRGLCPGQRPGRRRAGHLGPGATNLVTPIADAYKDSVPTLFITGQVPSFAIGTDAFQEVDTVGVTRPISKHNYWSRTSPTWRGAARGLRAGRRGRPGPVVVDICKDVQLARLTTANMRRGCAIASRSLRSRGADAILDALAAPSGRWSRPVAASSTPRRPSAVQAFAERFDVPVTTTFNALGAVPFEAPYFLGMPGMHGSVPANYALREADLILTLGGRFDDRVAVKDFAGQAHRPRGHRPERDRQDGQVRPGPLVARWTTSSNMRSPSRRGQTSRDG
jgi:acetolactate synthase-1/2/3 large subunit